MGSFINLLDFNLDVLGSQEESLFSVSYYDSQNNADNGKNGRFI